MKTLTMTELAEQSGVPARTIRFYITKNLLPGPTRQGPGAPYTEDHLSIVTRIKELQAEGLTLDQILQNLMDNPLNLKGHIAQVFGVTEGVEVHVNHALPLQRKNVIFRALEQFARAVQTTTDVETEREEDNA